MDNYAELMFLIEKTKKIIANDVDDIVFCKINECIQSQNIDNINEEHQKILRIFNGGRFGIIDIWDIDFLNKNQYRTPDNSALYEVGQILYEPIFINKINGKVVITIDNELIFTNFNFCEFVFYYIFGEGYFTLVENKYSDLWLNFINEHLRCGFQIGSSS